MYFCGETKCFLCGAVETLAADAASGWRAIKAENRLYYVCRACQPAEGNRATADEWREFYVRVLKKIYDRDFKRPIRKITILRDAGGDARIVTSLN
jgi:hypothetical protein